MIPSIDPSARLVIVVQGHSAWGQFSLVGRVRPCDGFISISKEYVCLRFTEDLLEDYLGSFVHRF